MLSTHNAHGATAGIFTVLMALSACLVACERETLDATDPGMTTGMAATTTSASSTSVGMAETTGSSGGESSESTQTTLESSGDSSSQTTGSTSDPSEGDSSTGGGKGCGQFLDEQACHSVNNPEVHFETCRWVPMVVWNPQ